MLVIDQRLAVIGFSGLEKLGKSRMRRGQRLGRKHFAKQDAAPPQFVLFHQHQPVHRLGLALAARAALLVVIRKHYAVRHQIPAPTDFIHEFPAVAAGCHPVPEPSWGEGIQDGEGCDISMPRMSMSIFCSVGSCFGWL